VTPPQYQHVVLSKNTTCNSTGEISCSDNGRLFYRNGTERTSNQTRCSKTAQWVGLDEVECWKSMLN